MQKKSFQTLLYSTAGVLGMLVILIAFNFITGLARARIDLTHEKAYTLSEGTRAILRKIDTPIHLKLYCTQGDSATPETVLLKNYAKQAEDLLGEFKQAAKGKLILEKYDPEPDSDAEDSARMDGIEGQMLRNGERFYLGVAITMLDVKEAIPFLSPDRERLLEYDIARAISRVSTPDKPVVGVMSPLPIFGMPSNPMMARMGQQGSQPWALVTELKNDFNLRTLTMDTDRIDDEVKVLVLIHPREISDKTQFAIDQFILRGGKLLAFLDPMPAVIDSKEQNQMLGNIPNSGSSLDKLLKAWGLAFDTTKVVADLNFKMKLGGRNGAPQEAPAVLSVTGEGLNTNDVVTSQIDNVWLPYAGAFTGSPAPGLKETVLLKSTRDSQLVDGFMANLGGENIIKEFKPSGIQYALAVRLTGRFKTAFADGKPEEKEKKDDEKKDAGKKPEDKKPEDKKADDSLKESKQDTTVVLVGDADMLYDTVALQQVQTLMGPAYMPMNGNLSFAQNLIEQLSGDNNLIAVRSRATLNRPFTRIQKMETAANEKFQNEIKQLEEKANEASRRINELQQQRKDKDQRFILSREQTEELAKLRKDEAETRKHLKQVQKDLRKEVVSLQTRVKWLNILAVPLAVTASGLVIAMVKRRKTSAK
jgi:ABC-type uncharacterized transport system involved in gliding motility auxiliary subunit